jgi:hypothetical protein
MTQGGFRCLFKYGTVGGRRMKENGGGGEFKYNTFDI